MSAQAAEAIEFRCNSCWQITYAPIEDAGKSTSCAYCQSEVVVPEATPDRLRSVDALAEQPKQAPAELPAPTELNPVPMPHVEQDFIGYPNASLMSRLLAHIVDSFYFGLAVALGVVAVIGAGNLGLVDTGGASSSDQPELAAILLMSFFPLVALIVQWNLIATRGQTVGKFVTCIRIVTMHGRLPGFVSGVVVRNWVRALLSFIPFFSLLDIVFIFTNSRRCIHDYIAGTRVVQS